MNDTGLSLEEIKAKLPAHTFQDIDSAWLASVRKNRAKIIALDDDPTGVQTVHDVPVYTTWDLDAMKRVFAEKSKVVYVLTNSRSVDEAETEALHAVIAQNILAAEADNEECIIISRSDSTLRGHYPLETRTLYREISGKHPVHGEILIPFFGEGGRITYGNVHYLLEEDRLKPVSDTEFARDPAFGYKSADLRKWIEEKTAGGYPYDKIACISVEELRYNNEESIMEKLLGVDHFGKIVVNAADYDDLKVFLIYLNRARERGKRYIFRTAASFIPVIGGILPKGLLCAVDFQSSGNSGPGLIVVGSFVKKTTRQLDRLAALPDIAFIEFKVESIADGHALHKQIGSVISSCREAHARGKDICLYTSRALHGDATKHDMYFKISPLISRALVEIIKNIKIKPAFILAKGGITSSDIGVKALGVKRAEVLGQIIPGVPVWLPGKESLHPGIPYVIFPGNVGDDEALKNVVLKLRGGQQC